MDTNPESTKQELAGSPTGRFCPSCRSPLTYTGALRQAETGQAAEQRCSTCGFTAWKRSVLRDNTTTRR